MKQVAFGEENKDLSPREQLLRPMIDAIAQTMDLYGANYSFGQLYGIMFFEDRPMTLEEMKNVMNMSKSNMSYGVRSLMASKMVTKLEEKRDRKDLYAVETDFFQTFKNFFGMKLQREIDVMKHALDVVIPELEGLVQAVDTSEEERQFCLKDLEKLEHAVQYYHWLQQFVDELGEENYFADKRRS
ncbi:transcriptional regulator [Paenibacillus sp. FSL R7-0048]|jgi:DNA-binding transcriptional regulator GbsR (MarR family)|uniref:HTH-type transcriptional regulator n=1 Tax=Paenibacillus odorifer TaxID=189426 RepID=A0ABX3GQQ1_9BACL|nr:MULTISPECIES: transcriptional regulator [Paenibacillus]MDH6429479.1 DNA-binding transcriptional regulator GbsR (MarR family) [Paenibacillus sp. PastH-4]MDH6445687.1 DNA-binding transcriptional regulator GbsR (MarR family) [Paenibacillus sp. PastF-4]MDH6529574.1 DNA-binding transcriptional regulator GbsR (MarR family) [Paenibacillus sp. PastH-3]OMC64679.1 transcriptional regulator [Paenibacillus odorifer]OMC77037.1 transcriptional regulator [Paenibacillus odorifer]